MWHDQQLYPFHPRKVQALQLSDFANRIAFCVWYLERCAIESEFGRFILFTDGIFNSHDQYIWADVNPKKKRIVRHYQERVFVNLWAGAVGGHFIGPIMLPLRLNAARYLQFLRYKLHDLLKDVPLDIRRRI